MKSRLLFCLIILALVFCIKNAIGATTYTWNGAATGSWTTAANWSPSTGYPGSSGSTTDIVVINTSNVTINYTGNLTINQFGSTGNGITGTTVNFTGTSPTLAITGGLNMGQASNSAVVITFSGTGMATISGTSSFANNGSMTISSGATVTFTSGSIIDFTANKGTLTNNGTLNLTGGTLNLGAHSSFVSTGTTIASNAILNITGTPASISYAGKFVANSCTFNIPNPAYVTSTSTSATFTATTSTFNLTGSSGGGGAYFYNNGTLTDHGSTYNLTGQGAYLQNSGSSSTVTLSGTTVNFSTSDGNNAQYIDNSGTFVADSATSISASASQSYVTNSGGFYAGISGSACVITLSGQSSNIVNTGTFYLGSTSIIYPTGISAAITNTSPGYFILQSDGNGSAALGAFSSTATATGTFNVERYFQGNSTYDNVKQRWLGRNYRMISSPVNIGTLVNSNNVYGLNYIVGSTAGQTTAANSSINAFITGCTGGSTSAGNPSVFLYRESRVPYNYDFTSGNFFGITNITNSTSAGTITTSDGSTHSIPIGTGVLFFDRGAATNWSTRTKFPYIAPENVTLTSTGNINSQQVTVKDWYTPTSSNLGYTTTSSNSTVRGFNMVGNPYPCSIDWNTAYSNTGITRTNISPTIYVFNPVTNQYDTYITTSSSTGTGTGNATNIIASGQGFFVQANAAGASLVFTESAKSAASQPTGGNLLMGIPVQNAVQQGLRLKLSIDSLNYDDIVIGFNSNASDKYSGAEDAPYIAGMGAMDGLSSISSDNVPLAINYLPLPKQTPQVIKLDVEGRLTGSYAMQRTALESIPKIYDVWLMDNYKKDSLDLRNNSTYAFNIDLSDTNSYGKNRFQVVIRQDQALNMHLLDFAAAKAPGGAQLVWKTENEENYTNFTVERSSDGGVTFDILGGIGSSALGTYSFLDKNPPLAADQYRLKIEDLNGAISYSNVVTLIYGSPAYTLAGNINVYPNPASSVINLDINKNNAGGQFSNLSALQNLATTPGLVSAQTIAGTPSSYNIKIISATGSVISNATSSQRTWQNNVSDLMPGTYVIEVVNNSDNSLVGKSTFVKL
ncbi:MAG TPA: T9SS type A sorting domain-containing protein [Mucilaginibacter sp.]